MFIPMELSRVLILDSSPEQFVTLAEKGGPRSFAIKRTSCSSPRSVRLAANSRRC